MKAYVITSGTLFALLVLAHLWRAIVEGPRMFIDPVFLVFTVLAIAMSAWAGIVLRSLRK